MKRNLFIIVVLISCMSIRAQEKNDTLSYEMQTEVELIYGNLNAAEVAAHKFLQCIPKGEVSERMIKANCYMGAIAAKKELYDIARVYYKRALKTAKSLSPQNIDLEDEINNQISILNSLGKDAVPEIIYDKSKAQTGDLSCTTCYNLVQNERFSEAIPSLLKWKEKLEKIDPLPQSIYYKIIVCLGQAYSSLGNIDKAFNLYASILEQEKVKNNLEDPRLRTIFTSMGVCYCELKNYTQAVVYSLLAKKLCEKIHDFGMEYVRTLSNLALCYYNLQWNFRAKMCIDEAAMLYEQSIGKLEKGQIDGLNILNTQALIYQAIGHNDEAIAMLKKITDNSKNMNKSQGIYQLALNNLATCYTNSGKYSEALAYFSRLHSDSPEQEYFFQQNVAFSACLANQAKQSVQALSRFDSIAQNNCSRVFGNFSEREREAYWTNVSGIVTVLNNAIANRLSDAIPLAYNNTIFTKNMLLSANNVLKNVAEQSEDSTIKSEYQIIQSLKDSMVYVSMPQEQRINIMQEVTTRERHLIQSIPDFCLNIFSNFGTWKDVQTYLDDNEAAIEFILLPEMKNIGNASTYYGALVLRKGDSSPRLIKLCPRYKLKEKLAEIADADTATISRLYTDLSDSSFYNMIWEPIEQCLSGVKSIYFSPTGDLNSLNYNAIPDNQCHLLSDKYNLFRLSSTAHIGEFKARKTPTYTSAVVYGGITYKESLADMINHAKNYKIATLENNNQTLKRSEDERGGWGPLNGTITESTNINDLLNSNSIISHPYQFGEANEESFKAMNHTSPDIIHVATHAFFIDDEDEIEKNAFLSNLGSYSSKDNNLLHTGLIFAGANNAWTGKKVEDSEDGILTADEISRLDLSSTKLVVLSACETGKGHIDPINGVFGLQRGFKKAGVETIVMSLWKVPDGATSLLMKNFYRNIVEGMDTRAALNKATEIVKKQFPNPYYWAAFVVLD